MASFALPVKGDEEYLPPLRPNQHFISFIPDTLNKICCKFGNNKFNATSAPGAWVCDLARG